ncbi:hypothetical protein PG984_010506 [Apiospora sp. TS-2023a]
MPSSMKSWIVRGVIVSGASGSMDSPTSDENQKSHLAPEKIQESTRPCTIAPDLLFNTPPLQEPQRPT